MILALVSLLSSPAHALSSDVTWDDPGPYTYNIDNGVAIDFGFGYTVDLAAGETPLLRLRTCEHPAGELPSCYTQALQAPAEDGEAAIRFGVDPSQYNVGTNTYSLTLILGVGAGAVEDTLSLTVIVD